MSQVRQISRGALLTAAAVVFLVAMLSLSAATPSPDQGNDGWKIVAASGGVEIKNAAILESTNAWTVGKRGDWLPASSIVRTGKRGRATLTREGNILIVGGQSVIELPSPSSGSLQSTVIQNKGAVLYEVDGKKQPHFEVITPYLVAGVKGTEFLVSVADDRASVAVERGEVRVTNPRNGDELDVRAGEFVSRQRGDFEMEFRGDDDADRSDEHRRAQKTMLRLEARVREDSRFEENRDEKSEPMRPDARVYAEANLSDDESRSDDLALDAESRDSGASRSDAEDGIALNDEDVFNDDRNHRKEKERDTEASSTDPDIDTDPSGSGN